MRNLTRRLANTRPEILLSVVTFALFIYMMVNQRITNIYTACRIDPYNTVNDSWLDSSYNRNLAPANPSAQDIDWCIAKRQSSLDAAWIGPFLWALVATAVVMGVILGVLYLIARYTNWLGGVAGLKPVAFFKCGCSDAHCTHCARNVRMDYEDSADLNRIKRLQPSTVRDEKPNARRPLSLLRLLCRGRFLR